MSEVAISATAEKEKTRHDSQTVSFTFNGTEVTAKKGATVMEVAKDVGIDIPHFCWHPGLSIAGVCRFCLVKVEGARKLEIACNLKANDGMIVSTLDPEVKEAHKWALEFHLVNHPLDCPICDQAGECGLQDFYMSVGKYQSQVVRPKALKPKALDIGGDLVLDTERCILCSRCVRFEEEITKTSSLGIFSRGDRAIIGTYPDKKVGHNYTTNLVDICPVGAFTSKDFRFKKRVWFLKDKKSICTGCSTGCAIDVFAKTEERSYYRVKPRYSEVNQHWMCDEGRKSYEHMSQSNRLLDPYVSNGKGYKPASLAEVMMDLESNVQKYKSEEIAVLIAPQYTCEEIENIIDFSENTLKTKNVLQWRDDREDLEVYDGLLHRGDKNPNSYGLLESLKARGLASKTVSQFQKLDGKIKLIVAFAPENIVGHKSFNEQVQSLSEHSAKTYVFGLHKVLMAHSGFQALIPTLGFAEKTGTFKNFEGKVRTLEERFAPYIHEYVDFSQKISLSTPNDITTMSEV